MTPGFLVLAAGLSAFLAGPVFARSRAATDALPSVERGLIEAEATCFDNGGVDIGYSGEEGLKVACMRDKRVQAACGSDGQVTRLHAYAAWFNHLKRFEEACASRGGVFAFEDPAFTEPLNESFCLQAQPEVGANMFESALCNYRSLCPSVAVVCDYSGEATTQSAQANLPNLSSH